MTVTKPRIRSRAETTDRRKTIARLRKTGFDQINFKTNQERIKVAVLDTGIDSNCTHALSRENDTVKEQMDFTTDGHSNSAMDTDGHGTQVAGLVLDIAPQTDLYIARICRGMDQGDTENSTGGAEPRAVANVSILLH